MLFNEDYLLRHIRADRTLQRLYPESLVQIKERMFAWAQVLYLSRMCEYVSPDCLYDVAVIKPGLPYLPHALHNNNLRTLTLDTQIDLLTTLEERLGICSGDVVALETLSAFPVPDKTVGMCASHNLLQKLLTTGDAKQVLRECMRISHDFVYHQITDAQNVHFEGDALHRLSLSLDQWINLFEEAVAEQGDGWKIREIHYVKAFDVVDCKRPPVFILERGDHPAKVHDISIPLSTRIGRKIQDEATLANVISLARPVVAHYGLTHLMDRPYNLSLVLAMAFSLDALDGAVARRFKDEKAFSQSTVGAYIDIFADRALELEALWMYAAHGMISPIIPVIFTAKGLLVDATRISKDLKQGDISNPLKYGGNSNRYERAAYGALKALYIAGVPILPEALTATLGIAATSFGVYRGSRSLIDAWKNTPS